MISQSIVSQCIELDINALTYQDCVIKSGILPEIVALQFEPASGLTVYDLLHRDTDPTTNTSGGSTQAKRNYAKCEQSIGWICNSRFRQLAGPPMAFDKKGRPRKYFQPKGKPLKIFFPRVTARVWQLIAKKASLPMPAFLDLGLIDWQLAKFIFCNDPALFAAILACGDASKFWEWVKTTNCPIVIIEGEKKACALISRGYAAIALPGINTGYRVTRRGDWVEKPDGTKYQRTLERELRSELQALDTAGREITIIFDYRVGDYSQSKEFRAACTTAKLFKNAIAKIAQLPGPDKGADDFCVAGGDIDAVISTAPTFEEIQKQILKGLSKKNREKAWALTYPIAWECNQHRLDIPYPNSGLICIKSPKGTGKTYALNKLAAKAQAEGRKVGVITHRIVLGRAICKVVEIPWIEEMNNDGDRKIEGKHLGHGLCIDSMHPTSQASFDPLAWEGALIIFDEAEQVFWHALNSSTCREHRQAILASLKVTLQTVLSSGGQVILQDADLSNISIDFVRELSGVNVEPWVAVNRWQPSEPSRVKFYDTYYSKLLRKQDDPSGLLRDAVAHINAGGNVWLALDSQKAKSKYSAKNLEKYLRKHCPGKKILRIDSETVSNPEHPAYQCAESVNGLATLYDIVIATPTLATGVSVDDRDGHFTAVFGIFQGAIADNEVRQSLARVRPPIPRFVWCRQIPVGTIGNGSPYYREVGAGKDRDIRYNLHLLKEFDFDIDSACDPVAFRFWAKFAARVNTSAWDFRDSVREGLVAEGHNIRSCDDDDAATGNQIKELRVINQVEEAIEVSQAEDIDRKEFEKLEQQRSKTDAERYQEEKFRLKEIYRVEEVTPELRQLDQDRWHSKIQLHYFLTHNPDFLWLRDRKHLNNHLHGDGKICQQDIRLLTAKIEVHKILNTLQFTVPDKEWTNKSPEVIEFAHKALQYAADIKDVAGIKISPKKVAENPIGIVGVFLGQLGLTLKCGKQQREGDKRKRPYSFGGFAKANVYDSRFEYTLPQFQQKICEPEGLRSEIFQAWVQRDELALFEFQQKGIAAVEADVTLQSKSVQSQHSSDLTSKTASVTPHSINKEEISPVTTNPTVETPPEQETGSGSTAEKVWAWYQVKADWIKCRVLGFVGDCYRLEVKSMIGDGLAIFKAFPEDLRWEAPN